MNTELEPFISYGVFRFGSNINNYTKDFHFDYHPKDKDTGLESYNIETPEVSVFVEDEYIFSVASYEKCTYLGCNIIGMLIDEFITKDTVIVEVGSFAGISSELFALHCKELYCVDLWDPYWEITDKQRIEFAEFSFDSMIQNYENVYKVKKSSVEASKDFEDGSLDLVYIDAAHDYDSVKQDILTWLPKIKKGG